MENGTASTREQGFLSRMALNDNKAGMEGLDRDKINKIIMESSKGSRFYENEVKREQQVNQRIEKMMQRKAKVTEQELKKAEVKVERMTSALEKSRDLSRVIVHVDMDAFYAAVEMRDCPVLKDKPMAVGSMSMLSTSNYHARKFGVRAAMPGFIAKKLCPDLAIVPTNFEKYRAVSDEIREIFADYDPHFQPLSLDEAYLDFTDHLEQRQSWPESLRTHRFRTRSTATGEEQSEIPQESVSEVEELSPLLFEDSQSSCLLDSGPVGAAEVFGTSVEEAVREMRFRIEQKTMLTASAGIAPNMMLAKVCSDKNKPNGQYRLPSTRAAVMDFIQNLPVRKVCGIGKVSEKMLNALGISSCSHLGQQMPLLSVLFSETTWHHFLQVSLGLGSTHIVRHEERKSMSTERTFKEVNRADEQLALCRKLCEDLAGDLKREDLKGKTVTLKLKNVNFEVKTRAVTLPHAVGTVDEIFAAAEDLLNTEIENEGPQPLRLRLMGVRISAFTSLEDRKSLQKSILGFLQPGTTDSSASSLERHPGTGGGYLSSCPPPAQTQDGGPWRMKPGEEQQSFFQKAHFKRLKAASSNTPGDGDGNVAPVVPSTDTESSMTGGEPKRSCTPAGFPASLSVSIPEAQASTSGCGGTESHSLTCPVCFRQVKTDDLNVFNRHIDQCLSGVSRQTNQRTVSDCESDLNCEETWRGVMDKVDPPQRNLTNDTSQPVSMTDGSGGAVRQQRSESRTGPVLVCPVCQLTQDTDDLSVFNCHVDLCLNRDVLHELGGRTSSPVNPRWAAVTDTSFPLPQQVRRGKTKRQQPPPALPSKKAKSHNTIDKFFR